MFSDFDIVEPDLLYLSNERAAAVLTSQHVKGTPDLVVKSPNRDRRNGRPGSALDLQGLDDEREFVGALRGELVQF